MSLDDTLGYEGGGFRRRRRSIGPKPKVNKQALLRKQLMKHFGGFFNEMPDQEAPPPAMSPPGMEGGRRRRRAKSPVRSKSPVRRRVKAPVRGRRFGGESLPGVETATNIFGNYFADPSLQRIANTSSNLGSNTGDVFSKLSNGLSSGLSSGLSTGGRKRRSASPKRRPVARRAASPKRSVVRRVARPVRRTF